MKDDEYLRALVAHGYLPAHTKVPVSVHLTGLIRQSKTKARLHIGPQACVLPVEGVYNGTVEALATRLVEYSRCRCATASDLSVLGPGSGTAEHDQLAWLSTINHRVGHHGAYLLNTANWLTMAAPERTGTNRSLNAAVDETREDLAAAAQQAWNDSSTYPALAAALSSYPMAPTDVIDAHRNDLVWALIDVVDRARGLLPAHADPARSFRLSPQRVCAPVPAAALNHWAENDDRLLGVDDGYTPAEVKAVMHLLGDGPPLGDLVEAYRATLI